MTSAQLKTYLHDISANINDGNSEIIPSCILFSGCAGTLLLHAGFLQLWQAGATLQLQCMGFSLQCPLLLGSRGSEHTGFGSCSTWAQQLWHTSLVALGHVESSGTSVQTHVPCIRMQTLNHWATREVPPHCILAISLRWKQAYTFIEAYLYH